VRHVASVLAEYGHLVQLLQDHTQAGVDYVIVGEHRFDPATEWWFETLPLTYRRVASLAHHDEQGHTVRVGTVAHGELLAPIVERLRSELGDQIAVQHWSALTAESATGSPTHILEAFARGVNKWTAIEALCADYGIDPAETVAVGDGLNDLEMVRDAGLGIAMGNARPEVQAEADVVVGTNDAGGLADVADLVLAGLA
jgi:hydroxymethylpyrimidine pyrophosphatase-like HAD family hydrolase